MTRGGLPRGRVTLLEGGPGAGKTIFALQSMVHAAGAGEASIFVAFEESPSNIRANIAGFSWAQDLAWEKLVSFIDAQPSPDIVQTGEFDLGGLLAIIGAKAAALGAKRITLDALDVMLSLLPNAAARRRELHRLYHWVQEQGFTAIITAKSASRELSASEPEEFGFIQFLVDCSIALRHDLVGGISQRSLRVMKYRGSAFLENAAPMVIGPDGIEVSFTPPERQEILPVTNERVSSGIPRLDAMLEGGYHRSASVLISGSPGTAKTTLSGAFAEAACARGEPTLIVSFDSLAEELVRNLQSVKIDLAPHLESGILRIHATRPMSGSGETHLLRIQSIARSHGARCLVVDPLSALSHDGNAAYSHSLTERVIDWAKSAGITIVCTSLIDSSGSDTERTPLNVSTIADTWIQLTYRTQAGERNRAMTIIKSRGTGHSNQVRELRLSHEGVTMEDVYLSEGEVLMGTLRWAREQADRDKAIEAVANADLEQVRLEAQAAEIEGRINLLQRDLVVKQAERAAVQRSVMLRETSTSETRLELGRRRRADTTDDEQENV